MGSRTNGKETTACVPLSFLSFDQYVYVPLLSSVDRPVCVLLLLSVCLSKIVSGDLTRFHLDSIYVDISLSWRLCVDCYLSPVVCRYTSFLASVVCVKRYLSPVVCRYTSFLSPVVRVDCYCFPAV